MSYTMPKVEQEKYLRIAVGNCRYSQDMLTRLPANDSLNKIHQQLQAAQDAIRQHCAEEGIDLHESMPT